MSHKKGLVGAQIKRVSEMIQDKLRDGELSVADAETIAEQARAVFTDRMVTVDTVMNIYHKGAAGITGEEMEEKVTRKRARNSVHELRGGKRGAYKSVLSNAKGLEKKLTAVVNISNEYLKRESDFQKKRKSKEPKKAENDLSNIQVNTDAIEKKQIEINELTHLLANKMEDYYKLSGRQQAPKSSSGLAMVYIPPVNKERLNFIESNEACDPLLHTILKTIFLSGSGAMAEDGSKKRVEKYLHTKTPENTTTI